MATTQIPIPRFLYVAACYSAAIVRLLAQASERRNWFTNEDAYREEVRRTAGRIGEELQELLRYSLSGVVSATGAWRPAATDDRIWGDTPSEQEE